MRRSPQHQYVGFLTPGQAAARIRAAISTARGLVADAELLLENERWQRATALSILAIEEIGKVVILRGILLARSKEELVAEWRTYRSHAKKNVNWIFVDLFERGAKKLEDFRPIYDPQSRHGEVLDVVKQDCFYSDVSAQCEWSSPEQKIGPDLAKAMFMAAGILLPKGPAPMTSEAELALWVKRLQPVWKGQMSEMKKAVAACYAEAESKGLLPAESSAEEMLKFLYKDSTSLKH